MKFDGHLKICAALHKVRFILRNYIDRDSNPYYYFIKEILEDCYKLEDLVNEDFRISQKKEL